MNGALLRLAALPGSGQFGVTTVRDIGCRARRNRQRRRVREAYRTLGRHDIDRDLVVTARATTTTAPFELIVSELDELLDKLDARWDEGSASS